MERVVVAAILMLATTAALADTASPVAPDVERRIATAARVRVAVPHGTFELVRPRAESGGLAFRSVKGYPRPRPALIVGDLPPMPEPPSSPLSWASISRIERPVRRYEGAGTVLGGTLGFAAGAVLGWTAAWVVGYETNSGATALTTLGVCSLGGMVLGAKMMGEREVWEPVYPPP